MRGDEVRWLRRSLNALHGAASDPEADDLYDEELAIAVQNFQREHRLNVDGIAGLQTQVVLDTALAEPGSPLSDADRAPQLGVAMSFILDALKKSELERQRQTIPGLMDAGPLERRPRFPLWAVALVVLLGVNLAVLLIVLLRSTPSSTHVDPGVRPPLASAPASSPAGASSPGASSPATPAPAASASAVSAPAEAPATLAPRAVESPPAAPPARAAEHFSPMDATPVYAPEIPADNDAAAASTGSERASEASGSAALRRTAGASPGRTARARDPVLAADEDKADEEVLPTIGEIDLVGPAGPA